MAKNTEVLEDHDGKVMTPEMVYEMQRQYMKKISTNEVRLAGIVRSKEETAGKPKVDRKTNEPVLDDNGQQEYWDGFKSVTIAFEGGETRIDVHSDWFDQIVIGERVLFEGSKGLKWGKVNDVYHSMTVL
jgi:hypothetical protein